MYTISAARALIARIMPQHFEQVTVELLDTEKDFFEVTAEDGNVVLRGRSGVCIGCALNWYLKNVCRCQISWENRTLSLPERLPLPAECVRREANFDLRYYLNYCTFGYSMVWWDWTRWEQEIDWMALHGINLPLAVTGHEMVWRNLGKRLGLTQEQIDAYLTGPAFLPWNYMGNIDGIGGPLPDSWYEEQYDLQCRILERERELGMTPVFPGFFGHVPQGVREIWPDAGVLELKPWFDAKPTYFLPPDDTHFERFAQAFYQEQAALYGNDHYFSLDLFHEGSAPSDEKSYLTGCAKRVMDTLTAFDSQAIWVMQSWSMRDCIVQALPDKQVLLLDLCAEETEKWRQTQAFYGKGWVWCFLHNYGGRSGMFGDFEGIVNRPSEALRSSDKGALRGIGFAPEAIEENSLFYDAIAEQVWRTEPIEPKKWIEQYIECRYGQRHPAAQRAWDILMETTYRASAMECVVCARPMLDIGHVCNAEVEPQTDVRKVMQAWRELLSCREVFAENTAYRYDVVNVGRECLSLLARPLQCAITAAYRNGDIAALMHTGDLFCALIEDMDELTSSDIRFMAGKWVSDARKWGKTPNERALYEFNAKMQITRWWPDVNFLDYAHKQWGGLLKQYYLPRWKNFISILRDVLTGVKNFDESAYAVDCQAYETEWAAQGVRLPEEPKGDTYKIASELLGKYTVILEQEPLLGGRER